MRTLGSLQLTGRAMEIFTRVGENGGGSAFAKKSPYSSEHGAADDVLANDGDGITTHGFRSSFSDWGGEVSSCSEELCEMALAHTIRNKAERAYRRGDALEKRREMMEAWADHSEPAAPCGLGAVPSEVQ